MEFWISSRNLGVFHPGMFNRSLRCDSVLIGTEKNSRRFYYNPFELYEASELTSPNIMVFGQIGYGKSAFVKALLSRHLNAGFRSCVLDPKGEYTAMSNVYQGSTFSFGRGPGAGLNPLGSFGAGGSPSPGEVQRALLDNLVLTFGAILRREATSLEAYVLEAIIASLLRRHSKLDLFDVQSLLIDCDGQGQLDLGPFTTEGAGVSRLLSLELRRYLSGDLCGIIDGTKGSDHCELVAKSFLSVDLFSALGQESMRVGVPIFLALLSRTLSQGHHRYLIALDEAWLALASPGCIGFFRSYWKLARGYGISNIAVVHRSEDLTAGGDSGDTGEKVAQGLISDSQTFVMFHLDPAPARQLGRLLELSNVEIALLSTLPRGSCLWRVAGKTYLVDVVLTEAEAQLFNTDKKMQSG